MSPEIIGTIGGQPMPPGGWPLRMAIFSLSLPEREPVVRLGELLLARGQNLKASGAEHLLWLDLVGRFNKGEVSFRGRLAGTLDVIDFNSGLLDGAKPDFDGDAIQTGDLTFYNVRVVQRTPGETYSSGVGGRPTSKNLWQAKLKTRCDTGEVEPTCKAEAAWLAAWLIREHPGATPGTPKTVENDIRGQYRILAPKPRPKTK